MNKNKLKNMKHITSFNSVAEAIACPGLYTPQVCMIKGQNGGLVVAKNSGVKDETITIQVDPESGKVVPVYKPANTKYMLIYEENVYSSINDVFDGFDELVLSLDAEAVEKLIGEPGYIDPDTGEEHENTSYNPVFSNNGPSIQWDPFLYSSFFEYCKINVELAASDDVDEVADVDKDTVIPCLITLYGVDRIVFLYPHICFDYSDNGADTRIYGVYFDDPNNKNSVHYIDISSTVSIETDTDTETGGSRVVIGETTISPEPSELFTSGPFDANAINKLYNTYIAVEFFQTILRGGVESGQLTVYSEYNDFASILVNKEAK